MRFSPRLVATVAFLTLLGACAPTSVPDDARGPIAASSSPSTSSIATSAASADHSAQSSSAAAQAHATRTYRDARAGFAFSHPEHLTVDGPGSFTTDEGEIGFEAHDAAFTRDVWIVLRPYDAGANRYEDICVEPRGYDCMRYGKRDLLAQKAEIESASPHEHAGRRATVEDVYAAPGGNLSRDYLFFTEHYRVSVFAHYDIAPLYEGRMTSGESLLDKVRQDIGEELANPIDRLIAAYPREHALREFYEDADAMVRSMREE